MKQKPSSNHVQIHGSDAKRSGSDPGLGKISRMRDPDFHPTKYTGGSYGQAPSGIKTKRIDLSSMSTNMRSLGLVFISLLVIGGFIFVWLRSQMEDSVDESQILRQSIVKNLSNFASPSETEAVNMVKRALSTRDPGKVSDCMRLGIQSPEEVVDFLKSSEERDGRIDDYEWLRSLVTDDALIEGVMVYYMKNKVRTARVALLVPDKKGVWKMDFESFARSCNPSWDYLLAGDAEEAEVRVLVARDLYFNGPFMDDSSWVCYALFSPDLKKLLPEGRTFLHGYCRVGSPQEKAMERIFSEDARIYRVILRIKKVEGADIRQFEITRVLAREWVTPIRPLDEKF